MEPSVLRLFVDKGPKKGEIVQCSTGSNIRIGRYVKGNNLTIKEAAISQKHLIIEVRDEKWVVLDLDSSNGTLLNDVKVRAMEPCALKDGDVIKIGEETSLSLKIENLSRLSPENGLRRYPRREVGYAAKRSRVPKRELDSVCVSNAGSIKNRSKSGFENNNLAPAAKKARVSKHEADSACVSDAKHIPNKSKSGPENRKEVKVEDSLCISPEDKLRRNPRRQVGGAARKARATKHDSNSLTVSVAERLPKELNSGLKSDRRTERVAAVENVAPKVDAVGEEVTAPDLNPPQSCRELEKITLGEWFDRMERYLPKQIQGISEDIISSMGARAKQFHEFKSQHDEKGKVPA